MISKEIVGEFAHALAKKADAEEVDWTFSEDGAYRVELPDFRIKLTPRGPAADVEPDVDFAIESSDGVQVVVIQVKSQDREYADVRRLIHDAESYMNQWSRRLEDAAKSIGSLPGRIGKPSMAVRTVVPPIPIRPSEDQIRAFFKKIAGTWDLKWPTGHETATINQDGEYFYVLRGSQTTIRPAFLVQLISCDPELEQVEIAKCELSGKTRQIEVLTVSKDRMFGFAKHDEHSLDYRRRE